MLKIRSSTVPMRNDWPVPGTTTFAKLWPELAERVHLGELTPDQAQKILEKKVRLISRAALARASCCPNADLDDAAQDLTVRLATSRAAQRYNPKRARPATYVKGFARMLVHERTKRRPRPLTVSIQSMSEPSFDGNQLGLSVRKALLAEIAKVLPKLSKGELRVLIAEFGPFLGHSCPKGRRRRCVDPEALEKAVNALRALCAHHARQ